MKKKIYPDPTELLEKQVTAIDNLIESEQLMVDMLQGTAGMSSYLWIYYTQSDELMQGFCTMIRTWINFQRSWKKGELLRMVEEGAFLNLAESELTDMTANNSMPEAMKGRLSPTQLRIEKLEEGMSDEQKKQYLEEYINSRYCIWPSAAPIAVICIGHKGEVIASVEEIGTTHTLTYK